MQASILLVKCVVLIGNLCVESSELRNSLITDIGFIKVVSIMLYINNP